jgi:starch phosphorylase
LNPETLRSDLERLAANHRWTWSPPTRELLDALPGSDLHTHPATVVSRLGEAQVESLASDADFASRVVAETDLIQDSVTPTIAYCSPEFGLTALLPQYAGGLGVLAGDHLKSASDLGTPLAGVGLFYREGVFRQEISLGRQVERYDVIDPEGVGATDTGVVVGIPFPGREVRARVWQIDVGRLPLLLLDTKIADNSEEDGKITDRLYAGSRHHRLEQEMVLGVGGARALSAMGWDIELHHLNEGHAGFIVLDLLDRICGDVGLESARETVRDGLVFTTHTPVPAGIDRFDSDVVLPYLEPWARSWGVPVESIWELGQDPDDTHVFNMAALCLRSARIANGVSELHGEVSRKLFAGVGIGDHIVHVTNGVHARTWTGAYTQALFDATLGDSWAEGHGEAWERVSQIDDDQLVESRRRSSLVLAGLIKERTGDVIDPDALIVGFARRFAPYKRATLLLRRPDLLGDILADDNRPVHFVFAGKAHPSDETGKGLVADLIEAKSSDQANGRLSFIPDYDMDVALAMVQGADVWLNNPIRPREASGTSGEKAVLNGCLNCSVLDGWWAEMYDGQNGWEIPQSAAADADIRDQEEATTMLETIAEIVNEYHGSRPVFHGRIRHAWTTLGPRVTSARMIRDYEDRIYRRP